MSFFVAVFVLLAIHGTAAPAPPRWKRAARAGKPVTGAFARVETHRRAIALTFDDGPNPLVTPDVLALLRRTDARATFFVTGSNAMAHPDLLAQAARHGEIANHSYDHPRLSLESPVEIARQLQATERILESLTGSRPRWFRPPFGRTSPAVERAATELGEPVVLWCASVDPHRDLPVEQAAALVMEKLAPGAILLAHDGCPPGDPPEWCLAERAKSLRVLERVLEILDEKGFEVVTVSELLRVSW